MVRVTASSIDDLKLIYKKLGKDFKALGTIKLNSEMEYELQMRRHEIGGPLKNILEKILETDEFLDDDSLFSEFSWPKLNKLMEADNSHIVFRPLKTMWAALPQDQRRAAFQFLCEEKGISPEDDLELIDNSTNS